MDYKAMDYKVVIPCAGMGKGRGNGTKLNKALITLANKPAIAYIVEKFDETIEIVVALGFQGERVKDFLTMAYPQRKFTFVQIDTFEGEGSGLGYTLLQCKDHLQSPFIFCSSDTLVLEEIPPPEQNWMGYSNISDTHDYRGLKLREGFVVEICSKGARGDVKPYIGLSGIHDFLLFWEAMETTGNDGMLIGESVGLRNLIPSTIQAKCFTWYDAENPEHLKQARESLQKEAEPNILPKEDEAIWFVNGMVIKFSEDQEFIKERVIRARHLYPYVPEIVDYRKNMYAYKKVPGEIFSHKARLEDFIYLLDWLKHFWKEQQLDQEEKKLFRGVCTDFYNKKTVARLEMFFKKFEQIDAEETINGVKIPKVFTILKDLDWEWIADGVPTRFHGDLHFENILINDNHKSPFTLLDWRQNFGGILEYGDVYYDLAKINHGLIICHELIHKNLFTVYRKVNIVEFDFLRKQNLVECEDYFKQFVIQEGYDYKKVQIITSLIFLNIAGLHHYPYSLLLLYLGKSSLYKVAYASKNEIK